MMRTDQRNDLETLLCTWPGLIEQMERIQTVPTATEIAYEQECHIVYRSKLTPAYGVGRIIRPVSGLKILITGGVEVLS